MHNKIDTEFLEDRIEERFIIFMEDGMNIKDISNPIAVLENGIKKELPNNLVINVSKYIAKYDYDIADKVKRSLRPRSQGVINLFNKNAILEILQLCSFELTNNEKNF